MKLKRTVLLVAGLVTLGLLLNTSAALAEPIVNVEGDTATGIQNLDVGGTLYNVAFLRTSADNLYGDPPVFDFPDGESAKEAKVAVTLALNTDNRAKRVGPSAEQGVPDFGIGFEEETEPSGARAIKVQNGSYIGGEWQLWVDADVDLWAAAEDDRIYADFSFAGPVPDPVAIGGSVSGLAGSGLVLRNNGRDDLPIDSDGPFTFDTPLTPGNSYNVTVLTNPTNPAQTCVVENGSGTVPDEDVTDVAVSCVNDPVPVTIGGNVTGLVGRGLVLQNNGRDDLPINSDGPFTFETPRTPGSFFDVTVATNPTNPAQICSVANGSGTVPTVDVTNVAVSCAAPVVGDLIKIATEGDTLVDGTLLRTILIDGGVSINLFGTVAFGGRDGDNNVAAFTQEKLVAREGATVADGTPVDDISRYGEVAISAGWSGERVAFHGQTDRNTNAVFTDARLEAKVGEPLPDDTIVNRIDSEGKVAINNLNQVAFHGSIELGSGFNRERFRAVFTSEGLAAREKTELEDTTLLETINEVGGVAIDFFGTVAFHGTTSGDVVDTNAVFTSEGLIAAEGLALTDDTIVGSIDLSGGVAINIIGDVAFIGRVFDPDAGFDTVRAVFTQDGPVVKEGDTLDDGTILDEISDGGVAINDLGLVAFHGRSGGIKGVFTQYGLVAKEGDNLDDNTTLSEILNNGGVAINLYNEVAFHAKVGGPNVVVVGLAPSPIR